MASELNDHLFVIEGGHEVVNGKSNYPDLLRVMIPKDRALELAMDVLNRLRNSDRGDDMLFELQLFGKLDHRGGPVWLDTNLTSLSGALRM